MLKVIVDNHILFVLMGIFVAMGVVSKIIVSITLKKLVKAASDMSKSSHSLMRLVRAKFEHACMVSDKVQNVEVFAQKYLYEHKVMGMRIHRLQRIETGSAWLCLITGAFGAFAGYQLYGMSELTFRLGVTGAVEAVLLFLLHKATDEKYQLEAIKTYMVDYLENVCARRMEKAAKKEEEERLRVYERRNPQLDNPERPRPQNEVPSPSPTPVITEPTMPQPNIVPESYPLPGDEPAIPVEMQSVDRVMAAQQASVNTKAVVQNSSQRKQDKREERKEKKEMEKEVRIREILEEFLA